MSRAKTMARVLIVNLTILSIGILVLELGFGNWLQPNRMNRLNLVRNVRLVHDVSALYHTPGGHISYTRDQYGFRGDYDSPGAIDILTMGGSATDQRYISDDATWQAVLSDTFARSGRPVSVVNAGVDGQSTVGHIKNFDWWFPNVPGLKVKRYLYYLGVNDFFTPFAFDELVAEPSLITSLEESSGLYGLFMRMRGVYRARVVARVGHTAIDFARVAWTATPHQADHTAFANEWLQRYRDRLRLLLTKTKDAGGTPICVTQVARYYRVTDGNVIGIADRVPFNGGLVNGVDYYHMMERLHDATLELCKEFGGIGVDAAHNIDWQDADFYDYLHNTPQGTRKLGEYLHAQLKSLWYDFLRHDHQAERG